MRPCSLALLIAVAALAPAAAQPRVETPAEALVRQAYADLARGDVPAVLAVLDDHVLWEDGARRHVGPGTVGASVLGPALARGASWAPDTLATVGDRVMAVGQARWTDPATGAPRSARFRDAWRVLDGRVVGVEQTLVPPPPPPSPTAPVAEAAP